MGGRFKPAPLGVVLLIVFVAAVVLALVGSGTEQIVGMAVVVFLALFALGGAPLGRSGRAAMSTLAARGATVREHQILDEAPADADAWQRERERREQAHASSGQPAPVGDDPFSTQG